MRIYPESLLSRPTQKAARLNSGLPTSWPLELTAPDVLATTAHHR
jgi:hypothetical protein